MGSHSGWFDSSGYLLAFVLLMGASGGTALAAQKNGRSTSKERTQAQIRLPGYPAAWKGERTLPEIKTEAMRRAKLDLYPVAGISPTDLEEAFRSIHALGKDQWGPAFIAVGDRYMAQAEKLAKSDPASAKADYFKAWRIYAFGRWPVKWSAGRQLAYRKSLAAFLDYAKSMNPPLRAIHIPYAGSEIVGYLRLPKNRRGPVPLVMAISGLDSRKEDMMERFSALLPYGIGLLTVDGPGTGQAPVKFGPDADRMFSRTLDYLEAQPQIDKTRIGVYGASLGSYWAAKLAFTEGSRLKVVVAQSPGANLLFQKEWVTNHIMGNHEYLYGFAPALMHIMGVTTLSQFESAWAANSLVAEHLMGKPSAPLLILGGAKDSQVPISDAYLLLSSGQSAKYAWINPVGGHMGRDRGAWPQPRIFKDVTLPFLVRELQPSEASTARTSEPGRR